MVCAAQAGRMGTPEDIGAAAAFLCSRDASYITGATLTVDGGWNVALDLQTGNAALDLHNNNLNNKSSL